MSKQLPPLKVGDRVAVYGLCNNFEVVRVCATITMVLDSGQLYLNEEKAVGKGFDFSVAHPKQCRRLIKKVRRRLFLKAGTWAGAITHSGEYPRRVEFSLKCEGPDWVEFVEVRKRK